MSIVYGLFSALLTVHTEGFSMQGPAAGSTVAQLGGSVLLPCSVDRPLALEELEVEWKRTDSQTLVHLFREGESRPESQPDSYRDRATFFNELIPEGNFSLLLTNVSAVDRGVYECVVHTSLESNRISMEIKDVEWLVVTGSDQPISAHAGEEVIMNCSVDTHIPVQELQVEWLNTDQDIMVLLFSEGESRPESQHEWYQGRAQFFPEEIHKGNFSLKLRDIKTEDKGEYMCSVHSDSQSANTTARLLELGLSSLHLSLLVFSISAPFVALGTSVPALLCIIKEGKWK
ncbi:butyrophilin subfamily 2 member A2-like [Megalops cyprinoides]|uniref:butyrophilin subfamily 2 member A2-like n=1 Tax=Megalops cyprinoides TaxID=118141 RepID=UPI0018653DE3|nr:butyrophilin subfamily 2 member A2-like [Megalops cyprinoides]